MTVILECARLTYIVDSSDVAVTLPYQGDKNDQTDEEETQDFEQECTDEDDE